VMVIGENRKFPAALIVPSFPALKEWCEKTGLSCSEPADMISDMYVINKYHQEITRYNAAFGKWEQVKKFVLLPKEWTIDGGELTPKLSLKRKVIMERNKDTIESIYTDTDHL
jgi:long-chain acyl-CoA synthetase